MFVKGTRSASELIWVLAGLALDVTAKQYYAVNFQKLLQQFYLLSI